MEHPILQKPRATPWWTFGGSDPAALAWLFVFSASGVAVGMCFEVLDVHAGPAAELTFFLPFLGYWAQALIGGAWVARSGSWRQGVWTLPMAGALVASAVFDGGAQAIDYLAQLQGGYTLFTILHSSVTFFACVIAAAALRARPSPLQWAGALAVVGGLLVTAFPAPVDARESFSWSVVWTVLGSFLLASSYPLSELVFRLAPSAATRPSEEMACFLGSLTNVLAFSLWTCAYTAPNWNRDVVQPIYNATQPSVPLAIGGYAGFALCVGVHSLSFWKSVSRIGTVATAVSKGAQQAGIFVFAHLLFCSSDAHECLVPPPTPSHPHPTVWKRAQKGVACLVCIGGCVLFVLGKKKHGGRGGRDGAGALVHVQGMEHERAAEPDACVGGAGAGSVTDSPQGVRAAGDAEAAVGAEGAAERLGD